jgi:hypothetical protein
MGQEHDDYREPGRPTAWERPEFRRRVWTAAITSVLVVVVGVVVIVFGQKVRSVTFTGDTVARARALAEACRGYRQTYPDRNYPATLAELAKESDGVGPFYDGELTDGWGNPFRYALVPNAGGELEPHIWGERTWNGRTTLHGAKLAADGTVVVFGLPND